MVTGAVSIGVGWMASWIIWFGSISCSGSIINPVCGSASPALWVPIAGPWIALSDPYLSTGAAALIVVDGIVQLAGLVMITAGVAVQRRVVILEEYSHARAPVTLSLVPAGPGLGGISLVGTF